MKKYNELKNLTPLQLLEHPLWQEITNNYFFMDDCKFCGNGDYKNMKLLLEGELNPPWYYDNTKEICPKCVEVLKRREKLNKLKNKIKEKNENNKCTVEK